MESARIVNMALNLSQSRRLASRGNLSQPTPPRLAPLPDNAPGGSLRYHLQQQRKMSRTVSPKPDRSPRIGGGRSFTPLQPAFEPGAAYRYHFSQSTLARAQKAKEYLELMAQYRRVLDLVAPLEPERTTRPWSTPPSTPSGSAPVSRVPTGEPETRIGRPYNPLQYIRNRKVRARERKAIDGAAQGFSDVLKVSEWIDEVAKWVATGQARLPGNPALPPFPSAQAAALQASPPTNARTSTVMKPRRPRVDWVIDPADMLADVYWLELDDNKKLVEDRHWRRVFPQAPDVPQPLSRDEMPRLATSGSALDSSEALAPDEKATPDPPLSRHEHEHVFSAARDRAQQKLRALKGSHHRQTSSVTNRDILRLRRGSLSESSDTDSDRRRRAKGGPGGSSTVRSVLEKQMEEMIAQEQREAASHPLYDHETQRIHFTPMTPEREARQPSQELDNRLRADSRAELSEAEAQGLGLKPLPPARSTPPQPRGGTSLEVPGSRRLSVEGDASQLNSPNLRPTNDVGPVPAIGMDLSPVSSRPSSPHRNPLSKVKSMFRDRSKERPSDTQPAGEDAVLSLGPPDDAWIGTPATAGSNVSSPQRRRSRSPAGERVMGHRSHKSIGSARVRGEDGGLSLRSLLRGPRIDTVLRSGVSKVSDMLWRRDAGDDQSSTTSTDDSDSESRGRSRGPRHGRHLSAEDATALREAGSQLTPDYAKSGHLQHPPAKPISRRSSRFDLLKPPRIDVQSASPSQSPPPPLVVVQPHEPVGSDAESQAGRDDVRAAAARLDAALTLPHAPRGSTSSSSRHWSMSDRDASTGPAVSKREIARLHALLLSAGIHAAEMDRRAKQRKLLPSPLPATAKITTTTTTTHDPPPPTWQDIARLAPDAATRHHLLTTPLSQTDMYPLAARALASSVSSSAAHLDAQAARFAADAAPALLRRAEALRAKVAGELTSLAQNAADAADDAGHDLTVAQRLKVKRVADAMDKMLRRRRRRFRWVRRAGWLLVEWLLVGAIVSLELDC
ncbi:uncharacterized protein THITE_2155981 [Thermothielavioides terrestris NRRL 8126]|uniref:Uncharacterized protein n=1 Tax=Thermothielavioides terrestris (strain ATCC 38088 / NRRL 8126) TaxID=578455 RepID=G2RDG3_THETT|nr:uncharacterized protein THITE_2155981 [Thermothielavioides terrestris NRRL 8126]AEO69945.1 hypothetical protein THITE_2155981 [Thermothielavioides terrestris NRRL 8126]